jgi:hypothetical protein
MTVADLVPGVSLFLDANTFVFHVPGITRYAPA